MPIVFVHGVANRPGEEQQKGVRRRDAFFRDTVAKQVLKNPKATIYQPFWGDLVPPFPKDNPIIPSVKPQDQYTAFGGGDGGEAFGTESFGASRDDLRGVLLGISEVPENRRLLTLARRSFTEAIDVLWLESIQAEGVSGISTQEAELITVGDVTSQYAQHNPQPEWLNDVSDDGEFIDKLADELEKWAKPGLPVPVVAAGGIEAFGVADKVRQWLKNAAGTVSQKIVDIPNDALLRAFRPSLSQALVSFFGDVFYYQSYRDKSPQATDETITNRVLTALRSARQEADEKGEALIVVGHSMGGNILYDILTHYDLQLKVDVLVTVGCQAAVFKQLNLFKNQSNGEYGHGVKAPMPPEVKRWLNIFDPQDLLSFAFRTEFEGVEDHFFESPGGLLGAHGDYFKKIRFYERLVARIRGV